MGEGEAKHEVSLTEPFWFGIYPVTQAEYKHVMGKNPTGPTEGSYRVYRGGSWYLGPVLLRSAYRICRGPGLRYDSLGFRVARSSFRQD